VWPIFLVQVIKVLSRNEPIVKISEFLPEEKWIKLAAAKDAFGNSCGVFSPLACKFCLTGAATKISRDNLEYRAWMVRLSKHIEMLYGERVAVSLKQAKLIVGMKQYEKVVQYFNDHPDTTFEDVQRVLQSAGM
jgi:hypothetical protein